MSASDKKQQRKALQAEGQSQKELREQAAAKAAQRKKTIYWAVGIICTVAVIALLVWNNLGSLSEKKNLSATAATVDGTEYTVTDMQYYYNLARQNVLYYWQMFTNSGYSYPYNPYVSDGAQWYSESDNKTYADYFREQAVTMLQRTAALCKAAKEAGYTLSEDGQKAIDEALAQIDIYRAQSGGLTRTQYLTQMYGAGMTEQIYVKHLTNNQLAQEYSTYYGEHLSFEEADLKAYYEAQPNNFDSYDFRTFYISGAAENPVDEDGNPLKDADGNTVTASEEDKAFALAVAEEKAKTAVASVEAAEDKEKTFISIAADYVPESSQGAYEEESYSLTKGQLGSVLVQNGVSYASWLMESERKAGDVTYVKAGTGYYVVLFLDRYLDDAPTVDMRHILIKPEVADDAETNEYGTKIPTAEAMEAAKAEVQSILDEWKAGAATEETFAALAEEHSDDGRDTDGDLYSAGGLYDHVREGYMVTNIDKWLFDSARKAGDVELIENNDENGSYYGWHIVYYVGQNEPYWKKAVTDAKQENDHTDWLKKITEETSAEAADGMKYVGASNTATPTPTATPSESVAPTESTDPAESTTPTESVEPSPAQ